MHYINQIFIKTVFLLFVFQFSFAGNFAFAQTDSTMVNDTTIPPPKLWKFDGTYIFSINESSFNNWASGGENQLGTKTILKPMLDFDNNKISWHTEFDLRYGNQKIGSDKPRKSDDELQLITKLGWRLSKKWKFSGYYTLNTQFTPSYDKSDDTRLLSTFMGPGYTNFSLGFDYTPNSKFNMLFSPANVRSTYVLNDSLSARGEYGVEPGSKYNIRFGPSALISYKGELFKNIFVESKLGYFQDALDGIGDPVVNWDALFKMKVNKFISAVFSCTLFYDEDSKTDVKDDNGNLTGKKAKVQFKQSLGVGVNLHW